MPFDNPLPKTETPPQLAEAANLIELGMARIATPDQWCKHTLMQIENGKVQRCVLGSFLCDGIRLRCMYNGTRVDAIHALDTVAKRRGFRSIPYLNNAPKTTHADVLDAMREAVRDLRAPDYVSLTAIEGMVSHAV